MRLVTLIAEAPGQSRHWPGLRHALTGRAGSDERLRHVHLETRVDAFAAGLFLSAGREEAASVAIRILSEVTDAVIGDGTWSIREVHVR